MIRKIIFGDGRGSKKASDYQEEAHQMCRDGLTDFTPTLTSPKKVRGALPLDMLEALHDIERQLETGQWLPSMEIYATDGAFNVWVGYNSHPEAVGLFTYRPDPDTFRPALPKKKGRK